MAPSPLPIGGTGLVHGVLAAADSPHVAFSARCRVLIALADSDITDARMSTRRRFLICFSVTYLHDQQDPGVTAFPNTITHPTEIKERYIT